MGYSLYHQLTEYAVDFKILAPTTMTVTNTSRVKTDKRDAANMARCLAFHTYSKVYVPDDEDNSVKEYIRTRDDKKLMLKKIKSDTCFCSSSGQEIWRWKNILDNSTHEMV